MNATGCVTALGDGGEAFVVLMPDADRGRRCRPEQTPCLVSRPPTPPSPLTVTDAYKSRPLRKDRGAFVVLPEVPVAAVTSFAVTTPTRSAATCSGRVSPFRCYGFKTPENGQTRASSPSSTPLKRQSSEPRMAANRRRPATVKQRLSVSTKDLSVSAGKPPLAPTTPAKTKTSQRKKSPAGPPTPRKPALIKSPLLPAKSPLPPKSPQPSRSPKTPRRPPLTARTGINTSTKPTANRQPPVKLSQRPPKKPHTSVTSKSNAPPPPQTPAPKVEVQSQSDNGGQPTVNKVLETRTTAQTKTVAPDQSKVIATPVAETTSVTAIPAVTVAPITASTSATAIATTHATNAVASPVVSGGPLVTAAPPPAAIAANTLATLSVIEPPMAATTTSTTSNSKPPQSAMRSRELPATAAAPSCTKATVIVVDDASPRAPKVPATTTPPLSYELQEIVVEPEIENLSGRNAATRSVTGSNGNKITFTSNSHNNNSHKTVAWARQSDKIIVPEERPVNVTKGPAYKRFTRRLCGGRRRLSSGKGTPATTDADNRSQKYWATAWKRRPRLCGRCRERKRSERGRPSATLARAAVDDSAVGVQRQRWWRRWTWCGCVKRKKKPASSGNNSVDSVKALGIAPPTMPPTETFFGKLKRRLCCCCDVCVVPNIVRRFCCCSRSAGGPGRPDAPKKLADRQRSLFKCTSCCTNIPKLDAVYVDHSSVMKGAIPVLPVTLAWLCLVFNVIFPGSGTFSSGILCLCVGKPRFTVNDNFQSRVGAFCVNFVVAAAQLFTVLFCLVGWGWSIWWGVIMLKMAKKYQKVKVIDPLVEEPIAVDHNHRV